MKTFDNKQYCTPDLSCLFAFQLLSPQSSSVYLVHQYKFYLPTILFRVNRSFTPDISIEAESPTDWVLETPTIRKLFEYLRLIIFACLRRFHHHRALITSPVAIWIVFFLNSDTDLNALSPNSQSRKHWNATASSFQLPLTATKLSTPSCVISSAPSSSPKSRHTPFLPECCQQDDLPSTLRVTEKST